MKRRVKTSVVPGRGLMLLAAWLVVAPVDGQENQPKVVPFEGTQAFCHILDRHKLAAVQDLASFKKLNPAETLLIVFGDNRILADIALDDFKQRGGAVLIASDRDDEGRLADWKLRIDDEPISELEQSAYKGLPTCPMIRRFNRSHPLFRGMRNGLATNRPAAIFAINLGIGHASFDVLAGFSGNCWIERAKRRWLGPFLVASRDDSRVIVMAGHSVFMNGMVAQPDNDNWDFAWNCVRWLSEGPKGPRKHALFFDEGRVKQSFDVPLAMPMPRLPTVQMLNGLLRGLEEENFFNRMLQRFVTRRQMWRAILIVATVVLLMLAWRRLGKSRFRQDASVPRAALEPPGDFAEPPPLMEERHEALVRQGNYWESGRALARFFFEEVGKLGGGAPPAVTATGSWWRRRALSKQIHDLWELAFGPATHLSARALARLPVTLDQLAAEIRNGRLLLQSPAIN